MLRRVPALAVVAVLVASCGGVEGSAKAPAGAASPSRLESPSSGGLFAAPQPWTVDVSEMPASQRSEAVLAALADAGGWGNGNVFQVDFQMPVLVADSGTPRVSVIGIDDYCYGGPDCDDVPADMPVPEGANVEGSRDLTCDVSGNTDGQGDCHLLVADPGARRLYELYQANEVDGQMTASGMFTWDLDTSYPDTLRGAQCTSADAAGFPIAALTPTADEVAAGAVDHALRFILPNDRMKAGVYVPPATHAGGPTNTSADAPPYGVNLRLRPDFDDTGYGDGQKVIIEALKKYGMYLSDGGEIALTFADDRTSSSKWVDLGIDAQSFTGIGVGDFEVVDHGDEVALTYDCVRAP